MTINSTIPDHPTAHLTSKYRPWCFKEIWNFPRDRSLQRLNSRLQSQNPARISIYHGPPSTAKTSVARIHGLWASCTQWASERFPCGDCEACNWVIHEKSPKRVRYIEIDATSEDAEQQIIGAYNDSYAFKRSLTGPFSDNPRPITVLIDEAHRLKPTVMERLLKRLENWDHAVLIFATTKIGMLDPALRSRAEGMEFEFSYPTVLEAATRLQWIAKEEGVILEANAAHAIATYHNAIPRQCLGLLEELLGDEGPIDLKAVESITQPKRNIVFDVALEDLED